MNKLRRALALLTLSFSLMMLTVVILEQHNPTMGFFTGTTFRVYQPIFCVLAAAVSALLLWEHPREKSEAAPVRRRSGKSPAKREKKPAPAKRPAPERKPRQVKPVTEEAPESYAEESYDTDSLLDESDLPIDEADLLPEDFDWDEYLN